MKNRLIEMFDPLKESPQSFDSRVLSVCRNGPLPGETTWKARRDNERRSLLLQHMPEDFRLRLDRAFQPSKAEEATIHTLLTKMKEVCKEMKESGVQPEQQDLASSTKTEPNDEDSFKASDNPANIFHRLQQGPGATVLDFVYEIEEMLVRCGYSHDFGEALAKDRLVVGLRDGEMRRQLNEMMDTPGGVSYEWLRFHAIRLDGGDLGYEEPPRSNDLEPSQPQHSSCSEAPLLPPFDSNVPPPLPFASCNVLPSQPPTSCNEPPPLPPASGNEPPPLPPISCNVPPPLPPTRCDQPPPLPPASCNVRPPLPPASCNMPPPPLPPASFNAQPPLPPASCNVLPPLPPASYNVPPPLLPASYNVPPPLLPASYNVLPPWHPASCNEPPPFPPTSYNTPPPLPPLTSNASPPAKRRRTLLPTPPTSSLQKLNPSYNNMHAQPPPFR